MSIHKEVRFEDEICAHLAEHGWLYEPERVASVEMNPRAKQGDLIAAIEPVADRLLKRYKAAQERLLSARARNDDDGALDAQDEVNALVLFKNDMAAYQRA